ncbi:MAG: hypothetical protein Kow0031_30590 [Anaerolineae bacterium]
MTAQRDTLATDHFTPELQQTLNQAAGLMRRKKQKVLTTELLLLAMARAEGSAAHQLLRYFGRTQPFEWERFADDVDRAASRASAADNSFDFVDDAGQRVSLGEEILIVLDEGLQLAEQLGSEKCSSMHVLVYMADIEIGSHWPLNARGITRQKVQIALERATAPPVSDSPAAAPGAAASAPAAISGIYRREKLETKLLNLLSLRTERNVLLVGEAGVGKRSLVLGIDQLIARGEGPAGLGGVVELDEKELLGKAAAEVERGIRRAQGGILFVPDIDRFFGGLRSDFGEEAGNLLQKAFLDGSVVIIGAATQEAFSKKLRSVRVITEHSQLLNVPPATVDETNAILQAIKPRFEADYRLAISEKSLAETARLAGRYYTQKPLPGAAVELLHRACAMASTGQRADNQLDPDDVTVTTSLLTGIPVNSMGADERSRYLNMVGELQQRIIGQKAAVTALSRAVKMARVGLKDPKRPIGSFMFLGPTGVGKSELAKALAEFMFGTEQALITLDMSEFMEASSVNRLIGSPPGYIGSDAGGQLTDAVKRQPYSVILFDEVEKADRKVFDVLLQVLDEGRLTSGQGELVSFSECVILMTSNIGGHHLADVRLGEHLPGEGEPDSDAEPVYFEENIRQLLLDGFGDEELLTLFGADPTFAIDPADLNSATDQAQIIELLLAQARQKSQFDLLLELAQKYNAAKYEAHEPYFNWPVACARAGAELKRHFRPEFLNRLDEIIYFHPLNNSHLKQIMGLLLKKEEALLAGQSLQLQVSDAAADWLLAQNDHPEWGARPLRRILQRHIREPLAEYLLSESPQPGTVMKFQKSGNQLKILQAKPKG